MIAYVVLERYAEWLQQVPAIVRSDVAAVINKHLDEMRNDDAFGTDGRCDHLIALLATAPIARKREV